MRTRERLRRSRPSRPTGCSRVSRRGSSAPSCSWQGKPTPLTATSPSERTQLMFTGILQPTHLIILLGVALIFLGPKRLPDAGRALGQGLREFKASIGHEAEPPLPEAGTAAHDEADSAQREETPPVST